MARASRFLTASKPVPVLSLLYPVPCVFPSGPIAPVRLHVGAQDSVHPRLVALPFGL
jgi:hypothetical protein